MSWEDRDYNREGSAYRSGGGGNFLYAMNQFFNWSFPIGTYLGIRVRVHILFLLSTFYFLGVLGWTWWVAGYLGMLFVSVLLHEFGHCLACRAVGGEANEILMWPLGGLAFCRPPRTVWAEFWTVAWGPLVTLLLAAGAYVGMYAWLGEANFLGLNPLHMSVQISEAAQLRLRELSDWQWDLAQAVAMFFKLNYGLFLFNMLLVFYPFDAGRLVQIGLWKIIGYYRSMWWATRIGIGGAVVIGLYAAVHGSMMLFSIALFGGMTCWQQMVMLSMHAEEHLYDVGYYNTRRAETAPRRRGALGRWRDQRAMRRSRAAAAAVTALHQEVDRILDKVKKSGLQSLTAREKKTLQKATEEQRRAG